MSLAAIVCDPCEQELPVLPAETCSIAYKSGEISRILFGKKGQPFTDVEDAAEHTTRQSQTATGDNAIRNLRCIGSLTYAQGDKQDFGTLGTVYAYPKFMLSAKVYNWSDTMYQAFRTMGCNGELTIWPISSDGEIIGGNDGITAVVNALPTYPESNKEKRYFTITVEKDLSAVIPEVGTYPLDMNL